MAQRTLFQLSGRPSLTTVSIIGSAGRRGDAEKMTKDLYWSMVEKSERVISDVLKLDLGLVHLVSGGAAWADHVAVTLFLQEKAAALTLHIPATWQSTESGERFEDNGKPSQSNAGRVANKLHKNFSEKINEETLKQIECSRHLGAKLKVHDGFKKRNDSVAKSKYLIAFSWSKGEAPTKGGTLDTWSKCEGKKVHIPLSSLGKHATTTYPEHGCSSVECFSSSEVLPSTHAEQEQPLSPHRKSKCSDSSSKLPCSTTLTRHPHSSGFVSVDSDSSLGFKDFTGSAAAGSVDSGIGSLDSSESAVSADKPLLEHNHLEGRNKRKRSESVDIFEDSHNECDGVKPMKQCYSISKKNKLSDFDKQH